MADSEFDEARPFKRAAMRAAGLDTGRLRRRDYLQIFWGVWIHRDGVDDLSLIRAALLIHPDDSYASYVSAATVLGLPVPEHAFAHVTVLDQKDRHYRPKIKPHVTDRRQKVIVVNGIRTTDAISTFIDCAGWLSFIDLIILGDALVKKYKITPRELMRACKSSTDYYAGLARLAAQYVRKGVDSPMETRLRMLIVLAGLPEPTVNVVLVHEDGSWKRRFDLCYPGIKLVIEYDGRQHAEDPEQWNKDLERREELDDGDYRILVVTAKGIYVEPARTLQRIHRQLVLRGYPDVPAIDDAWKQYFAA